MTIDYSQYTLSELQDVHSKIDVDAYPDRFAEIESRLNEKLKEADVVVRSKEQIEEEKYFTFWRRFWASVLDGIFLSIFGVILSYIGSKGDYTFQTTLENLKTFQFIIYSIILHGLYGQTIGKMAAGVKVVDAKTEMDITFKQAILRDIVPIISIVSILILILFMNDASSKEVQKWFIDLILSFGFVLLGWQLLEIITMLFNKKRRAVHDFIAGTVVIRT